MSSESSIKIGVLTSGGDAQGMNAAVRAVEIGATGYRGVDVKGIVFNAVLLIEAACVRRVLSIVVDRARDIEHGQVGKWRVSYLQFRIPIGRAASRHGVLIVRNFGRHEKTASTWYRSLPL